MKLVQVELSERSYPIWIGTRVRSEQMQSVREMFSNWKHAFLVVDENLVEWTRPIVDALSASEIRASHFNVPSGETSKSVEMLSSLWSHMLDERVDRKTVVLAIGGGVVGDLAGFAAASFMRGLRFLQIPTTLLSMVDSSVGGKTGINLPKSKNMVGAFWQPHAVLIDTATLDSLPEREYRSGLAEVVKYGVILDKGLFEYLEGSIESILARESLCVEHMVQRSCELKAKIVSQDERETTGLRAILNYGHTFGHAIEATTSYGRYLHGEAVSIGMTMAGQLAVDRGLWREIEFQRQTELLERLGLPVRLADIGTSDILLRAMQHDKKTEHGILNLILPTRLGNVESFQGLPENAVRSAMEQTTEVLKSNQH